jgi:uncharacterized membrane protein YcaP (DUF421 family)
MDEFIRTYFGSGRDLSVLQMSGRALIMFFVTLIMIRIAGIRTFGSRSPFDNVIVIMLGAILSRAVVGVSPFLPIIAGSLVLCIVHRILGFISVHVDFISHLLKGKESSLYKDGSFNRKNMIDSHISMGDLMGQLRLKGHTSQLDDIKEILMERSGEISVIKK